MPQCVEVRRCYWGLFLFCIRYSHVGQLDSNFTTHIQWQFLSSDQKDVIVKTGITSGNRQEELMAFAPKACIAQADPQPPQSPPVVPFPFMKLSLELRTIVYKIHLSQPAGPYHFVPPKHKP